MVGSGICENKERDEKGTGEHPSSLEKKMVSDGRDILII